MRRAQDRARSALSRKNGICIKTYKIRLVGPFCSRDYFHAFPHCIDLIIEVWKSLNFEKNVKFIILSILFRLKLMETSLG